MSKNLINYKKIDTLIQKNKFCKDNILSEIEKLIQQISVLSEKYKDENVVKIYDILLNNKIVSLKQGCNKIEMMNEILNNVTLAYKDLDERVASKFCKENE